MNEPTKQEIALSRQLWKLGVTKDIGGGEWYCPVCREELDGSRVTFEERCDTCFSEVRVIPEQIPDISWCLEWLRKRGMLSAHFYFRYNECRILVKDLVEGYEYRCIGTTDLECLLQAIKQIKEGES